ncbi:hypothetical protein PG990_010601 [Apiospora arundinis]
MHQQPDTFSLKGKTAIVTGSGRESGLGAGMATALARNGASVVLNYVSDSSKIQAEAMATRLRAEYGVESVAIQANVETPEGAVRLVEEGMKGLVMDKVDILVNNAGCNIAGSTMETPLEDVHKQFSVNTFAAIYMVRAAVPHMPSGGRIINISTICSKLPMPSVPFYSAAKAALDSLASTWAAEFGRSRGITVNTVAPGPVGTDEVHKFVRDNPGGFGPVQDLIDRARAADRMGSVDDVADAVLLLAQEKSRWITGQYIDVSGGVTGS